MKKFLLLTLLVLTPYVVISQTATDSLTCFTPTQLRLIAQDIERGEQVKQILRLKDKQLVNLETQILMRDSVIISERDIKSLTELAHRDQLKKRTLQSLLVGWSTGAVAILLVLL